LAKNELDVIGLRLIITESFSQSMKTEFHQNYLSADSSTFSIQKNGTKC